MIMAFTDQMRGEGHAAVSVCRLLREQGLSGRSTDPSSVESGANRPVAAHTITDAQVLDVVCATACTADHHGGRNLPRSVRTDRGR